MVRGSDTPRGIPADAQYFFDMFFDSEQTTVNVVHIAEKRGITASTIQGKLREIRKRNPGWQVVASRVAGGLPIAMTSSKTQQGSAPEAKLIAVPNKTTVGRKRITIGGNAENDSSKQRRTRSASRAGHEEVSESENEQSESDAKSRPSSRAHKSTAASKGMNSSTISNVKTNLNGNATITKKASKIGSGDITQREDHSSDEDDTDDEYESKPTPKTRAARKSVGRELGDVTLELPKPAPRGRNANTVKAVTDGEESTVSFTQDQPVKSIEKPEKSSCRKVKNSDFVRKLITESSEDISPSTKRKRTPSPASLNPITPSRKSAKKTPSYKSTQGEVHVSHVDKDDPALILTPLQSPSKQPPAKKHKPNTSDTERSEKSSTQSGVADKPHKSANQQHEQNGSTEVAPVQDTITQGLSDTTKKVKETPSLENILNSVVAPDASVDYMNTDSIEELLDQSIESAAESQTDVLAPSVTLHDLASTSTSHDDNGNDDVLFPPATPKPKKQKSPRRYAWQEYDPTAIVPRIEGLGRVVSNEYAQEWRKRNAAMKSDE